MLCAYELRSSICGLWVLQERPEQFVIIDLEWPSTDMGSVPASISDGVIVAVSQSVSCERGPARGAKDFTSFIQSVARRWRWSLVQKNSILLTLRYIKSTVICYRCDAPVLFSVQFCSFFCFCWVFNNCKLQSFKQWATPKKKRAKIKTIPPIN